MSMNSDPGNPRDSGIGRDSVGFQRPIDTEEEKVESSENQGPGPGHLSRNPSAASSFELVETSDPDSDPEEEENSSSENQDTEQEEIIMASPVSELVKFSGHPKGSTYRGPEGNIKENYTVTEWLRRVEDFAKVNGWKEEQKVSKAAQAFVDGTPAWTWYHKQTLRKWYQNFAEFKQAITDRFRSELTAKDRVDALRSLKQARNETTRAYLDRVETEFEKVVDGAAGIWKQAELAALSPETQTGIKEGREKTLDFVMQCFFEMGLNDEIMVDITKAGVTKLEDMLACAARTEKTKGTTAQVLAIGELGAICGVQEEQSSTNPHHREQQGMSVEDIQNMITAAIKGKSPKGKDKDPNKKKDRRKDFICHFCLVPGHTAYLCKTRRKERQEGKWRPTIKDKVMTREEFYNLTAEERQKGSKMAGEQTTNAAISHRRPAELPVPSNVWQKAWMGFAQEN